MKFCLAILSCAGLLAADLPHIFYSKSFPGSDPPFMAVTVDKSGAGQYREAEDDTPPLPFHLNEAETAEVFGLAEKLGYFDHPIDSGLKIAFTGAKTFRFEDGPSRHEVKFNYSEDPNARLLLDWFERISESEQHLINLETCAKYDKLGVMKALLQLETDYDHKRLVNVQQYLGVLDRIAKNESYLHQARLRAAGLADQIRAAK